MGTHRYIYLLTVTTLLARNDSSAYFILKETSKTQATESLLASVYCGMSHKFEDLLYCIP